MASKRDLVEAHAYNRRRLISAFLSGAPGGREVESVSRSKPVIGGVVVGAVVLAGAAIAGLFAQPLPDGWDNGYVIIGKSSAARFVSIKGVLHPVLNATSARLILPSSTGFRVQVVDDDKIAATPKGSTLGILGAPDDLPPPRALVQSGWISCLDGTTPRTSVTTLLPAPAPSDADGLTFSVRTDTDDARYLVTAGHRFRIPTARYDAVKQYLNKPDTPNPAPGTWIDLFVPGTQLDASSFGFPDRAALGRPLPAAFTAGGAVTTVGQLVSNSDQGGAMSVMLADGLVPLTPFASAVYQATAGGTLGKPVTVTNADLAQIQPSPTRGFIPDDWPSQVPGTAAGVPCAGLETADGKPAATHLVVQPKESPRVALAGGLTTSVEPGHGALFRASSTGGGGPVYVLDQSGKAFNLTDPSSETLSRLGYAGVTPRFVPPSWLALFGSGPALNETAVNAPGTGSGSAGPSGTPSGTPSGSGSS